MLNLIKSKESLKADFITKDGNYERAVYNLVRHEKVELMKNFVQHRRTSCFEHCLCVSYLSYLICRKLGLDDISAARGGLLHDFFLYDWHIDKPYSGWHGFKHPVIALQNANQYFVLNDREKDIILKHMWPLTLGLPRYSETFIVILVDKYCALAEMMGWHTKILNRLKAALRVS